MENYSQNSSCTTLLLLRNNQQDSFLVVSNPNKRKLYNERLAIPGVENYILSIEPEDMVSWISINYFQLDLTVSQVKLLCTLDDGEEQDVHLFTNCEPMQEIDDLFANAHDNGSYQIMTFHRAGLLHCGLDQLHRKILAEDARLINLAGSSSRKVELMCAYASSDLRTKMLGYAPKPL
ncbi:hypothetical protein H6789_02500 [Candidatus Nomurabacteria bacterium]|nr:hypothetical protein [Candidatus Kaiserbacteria bacterium]MCB9815327.1 hypothetical protein [Candidatus Nomurabacteria bacterium]MCB9819550.1 hypothetical protein [Candidatus Nomurabacteria bacterium]